MTEPKYYLLNEDQIKELLDAQKRMCIESMSPSYSFAKKECVLSQCRPPIPLPKTKRI